MTTRFIYSLDTAQPDLVPIRIDAPRAQPPIPTEATTAGDAFQNDTVVRKLEHLPSALVDDPLDALMHAVGLAAERKHLDVEQETAIPVAGVQRVFDLRLALYLNVLSGPEVEYFRRSLATSTAEVRILNQRIFKECGDLVHEVTTRGRDWGTFRRGGRYRRRDAVRHCGRKRRGGQPAHPVADSEHGPPTPPHEDIET